MGTGDAREAGRRPVTSAAPVPAPSSPAPPVLQSVSSAPPPPPQAARQDAGPAASERSGTWPGTVLSGPEAEGLLAGALAGVWPEAEALSTAAERTLSVLSDLAREALRGAALPVEAEPLRRAAGLRFRLLQALASAPQPGRQVDGAAVGAILAGVDAALADLKRLEDAAPGTAQVPIGELRVALVKEAIDFTEAVQRISPAQAPEPAARVTRPAPSARVLSNLSVADARRAAQPGRRRPVLVLALVAVAFLLAGGYHARRVLTRPPAGARAVSGAPDNLVLAHEEPGRKILITRNGKPPDPGALERFRQQEALKGNVVEQLGPEVFAVSPASPPRETR